MSGLLNCARASYSQFMISNHSTSIQYVDDQLLLLLTQIFAIMKQSCIPTDCLYLVTDSDLLVSSARSLEDHIEQAVLGGVNVVQLREKEASTRDFIIQAKALLKICHKHKVPLVINDRVDVALAVGADGVHIGQDDMNCVEARKLLGPNVFIGVSVNNLQEARQAVSDGADYLGVGAVYDTMTKKLTKPTMGPSGVREILEYLSTLDHYVSAVAIGGLNAANIERVMFASSLPARKLDGIALVSAIMTSSEPRRTASGLKALLTSTPAFAHPQTTSVQSSDELHKLPALISRIRQSRPLIQHMTNNVVKNFSANVTIAVGGSPAMSEAADEVEDFANANGALLVNMGMLSSSAVDVTIRAAQLNNKVGNPCLFDPVGAGASSFRRAAAKRYLDESHFDVVKGNEGEIRACAGLTSTQRGVDNITTSPILERIDLASSLARQCHNIVVVSGVEDIVSNGQYSVVVEAGHPWLGEVTGSGCSLGSVIASALAVNRNDQFSATVAAVVLYGLSAEHAAAKKDVNGPGTFIPAFIDSLYEVSRNEQLLADLISRRSSLIKFH